MKTFLPSIACLLLAFSVLAQDTTAPVVTLYGQTYDTIEVYDSYAEPGYSAMDDVDGDLTNQVTLNSLLDSSHLGVWTIEYTVSDISGNTTSETRWVTVLDTQAPVLNLAGDSLIQLQRWAPFDDPGYTISDNYDPNPTVILGGTYQHTMLPGCFHICYQAIDQSGNRSKIKSRLISIDNSCTTFNYDICNTPVGINIEEPVNIDIYPNPASDVLIFKNGDKKIKAVDFINIQGKVIATSFVQEMTLKIPEYLTPGIYFLRIELADKVVVKKQVIE